MNIGHPHSHPSTRSATRLNDQHNDRQDDQDGQVSELLERVTRDLRPNRDLVTAGIAAGRRDLIRGRVRTAAVGVVAATATAGAFLALMPSNAPGTDDIAIAKAPASGLATSGHPRDRAPSLGIVEHNEDGNDGPFPVAADQIAPTLAALVDGVVTNTGHDQSPKPEALEGWQGGHLDLNGATVRLTYQHTTGPRCDNDAGVHDCRPLGDGYIGTVSDAGLYGANRNQVSRTKTVLATYYTPNGYKITATAMNASRTDVTHPVLNKPVLTRGQLIEIVSNPIWQD